MKYFLASSIGNGTIPYWISSNYCGAPFISDIQSGVFYPLSFIFYLTPFPLSFNLYILLHFFLGLCFFYAFIKGLGLSKKAALITAIAFCYGGYTIASVNTLNNLSTSIWLPAILWAYHKAKVKGCNSGYFLCIIFLCMSILGGEPQLFIMSTGLLILYSIIILPWQTVRAKKPISNTLIVLVLILSAILICFLQLGMTYLDYQESMRLGGFSYKHASRHSLDPNMLKHLILPLHFDTSFITGLDPLSNYFPGQKEIPWLLTVYPGMIIVPLAMLGVFSDYFIKTLFWLSVFFISLTLALGSNTPLYYIFYKVFPVFRFPAKFMFPANFCLLVLAAYGIDKMFQLLSLKQYSVNLIFYLTIVVITVDLYSAHRGINPFWQSDFYKYYHPSLEPIINDHGTFRIYSDPEIATDPPFTGTILNDHIRWQATLSPNLGIFQNISNVGGTQALELRYQYIITEILLKPWKEKINFLRLCNVKYIISSKNLTARPDIKDHLEKINELVYRIKEDLPRAWLVGNLLPSREGMFDNLLDGSFEPANSALANGNIIERYNTPYFKDIKNIRYKQNGAIHIELTNEMPGILVLAESSYPGWRVLVDGEEKDCLHLNLLFQGVEIGPGKHEIQFIYRPKYFNIFIIISVTFLSLFFILWFRVLFLNRRRALSDSK